jgi:cytochrome oxidase Cu insertion factor (SCO1/SenC/PrrC family)
MRRRTRNIWTLGAITVAIGLFAVLGIVQTKKSYDTVAVAKDIPGAQDGLPSIGGSFQLVDTLGKVWNNTDFIGKPMLVYFGYAYCPDICPTALSNMTKAIEVLGGGNIIQPIFITLDPDRDSPSNLGSYAQNFHKDFIMLTGTKDQVKDIKEAYKVHAARTSTDPDYLMDHSSLIYLMDKEGIYRAHFNHNTPPEEMVERVNKYIEKNE